MKPSSARLVALVVALAPASALAQGGSVTTSPLAQPAPTLSVTLLLLLSLALLAVARHMLRTAPKGSIAALALAALTAAGAGIGYAIPYDVVVDGDECNQRYTHEYNSNYGPRNLRNDCANPVEVVALTPGCNQTEDLGNTSDTPPPTMIEDCGVSTVLGSGESCRLPDCTG